MICIVLVNVIMRIKLIEKKKTDEIVHPNLTENQLP